jgi:hypothetical protein
MPYVNIAIIIIIINVTSSSSNHHPQASLSASLCAGRMSTQTVFG